MAISPSITTIVVDGQDVPQTAFRNWGQQVETDVAAALAGGGGATPDASETVKGKVELATVVETTAGTDTVRATTPQGVKAAVDAAITAIKSGVSTTFDTLAKLASLKQNIIQFKNGGANVGAAGGITNLVFTGAGVTVSESPAGTANVVIPGGSGSGSTVFVPPTKYRILGSGQSNMLGRGTSGPSYSLINPKVKIWNNTAAIGGSVGSAYVAPTLNTAPFETTGSYNNLLPWVGERIYENLLCDVELSLVAQTGTAIDDWVLSGVATRPLFDRISAVWTAQGAIAYDAFVWYQGESDGLAALSASTYKSRLLELIAALKANGILAGNAPIMLCGLATNTSYTAIDDAIREVAADNAASNFFYCSVFGLDTVEAAGTNGASGATHLTGAALSDQGFNRVGIPLLRAIGLPGTAAGSKSARKIHTTAQNITDAGSFKVINWQGLPEDNGPFHQSATPNRFVIPKNIRKVECLVVINVATGGTTTAFADVWINVYDVLGNLKDQRVFAGQNPNRWCTSGPISVGYLDQIEVGYRQFSGATRTTFTGGTTTFSIINLE